MNMLLPSKKNHVSCLSLLADLAETSLQGPTRSPMIPIYGIMTFGLSNSIIVLTTPLDLKTPMISNYAHSPEMEYFRVPQRTNQASRWKEDWEELELLVCDNSRYRIRHDCNFLHSGQGSIRVCCQSSEQNRFANLCRLVLLFSAIVC